MNEPADVLTLQIVSQVEEAHGVTGLILSHPLGKDLPAWEPGAHIDVYVDLPGEVSLIRQYSLCGSPGNCKEYRVAVLREPNGRGGSDYIHKAFKQGQLVRVSVPRNTFRFELAERMIFFAGGIGITPLIPMLEAAAAAGVQWDLHYAGREPETMAFGASLASYDDHVHMYPSVAGERMALGDIINNANGALIYACGPDRLLSALEAAVAGTTCTLRVERFVNDAEITRESDHPFEVELAQSGKTITVAPEQSILDAVTAAGVAAPSSCKGGTCGTCETFVLGGVPDHRDAVLNEKEREESEVMMICVSRCKGNKLILEI